MDCGMFIDFTFRDVFVGNDVDPLVGIGSFGA